jgi:plasmid stabilization system protein ParE
VNGALFSPRALRELRAAAAFIAEERPETAEQLLLQAIEAAERIAVKPMLARVDLHLAPARFRFWSLRGFPYLLVIDTKPTPPLVTRFVHQARDLPAILRDL